MISTAQHLNHVGIQNKLFPRQQIPSMASLFMFQKIVLTLEYASSKNIIYHIIKETFLFPENIYLSLQKSIRIISSYGIQRNAFSENIY